MGKWKKLRLGIFKNSKLCIDLQNNLLRKGGFLVGDDVLPLKTYLLKPWLKSLNKTKKIFNYRVSWARWLIENAFGILASRFRIFQKPIPSNDETTDKIIRTSCALPIGYASQIPAITFQGVVLMKKID